MYVSILYIYIYFIIANVIIIIITIVIIILIICYSIMSSTRFPLLLSLGSGLRLGNEPQRAAP